MAEEGKRQFLLKILILSCRIILYTLEENIFVVIVYMLFSAEEILKRHIKDCFQISRKQSII